MNKKWINLLCDPETKEDLILVDAVVKEESIISGILKSSKNEYVIKNGIPRFLDNNDYNESFSFQWHKWQRVQFENENSRSKMQGHTKKMFTSIVDVREINNSIVLDLGCGVGRFSEIALNYSPDLLIAVDYANSIEIAKKNLKRHENKVFFIQCDALKLPIKSSIFDASYSIGVLHHTPDYKKGFSEMVRTSKSQNGYISISLYPKGYYSSVSVNTLRKFLNLLYPPIKNFLAVVYCYFAVDLIRNSLGRIPILRKLIRKLIPYADLPDRNWSLMDTFDSITPRYQYTFTKNQVRSLFNDFNLQKIEAKKWGVSHSGYRQK